MHGVCFHCGDNHSAKVCRYGARKVDRNGKLVTSYKSNEGKALDEFAKNRGVCRWCLGKLKNGEKHGPVPGQSTKQTQCALQKRLKRAIFMDCRKTGKPFGAMLREIHSSDDKFYAYVAGLNIDVFKC